MKVRLTINGTPFGQPMRKELALVYLEDMKFTITGLYYQVVKRCRR